MWTAPSSTAPIGHHLVVSVRSSFGIMEINLGSLRIAIADRRGQPFGTMLLTTCLQSFGRERSVRLTARLTNNDTDMVPNKRVEKLVGSNKK